jgi:hypothetical protein
MLHYQGQSLHPTLAAAVQAVASKCLGRVTLEQLATVIASDPDAGRATEPLPSSSAEEQSAYDETALLATWGSPAVWVSFFAGAEISRSQLDSLDFFDRCTFVQHGDVECLYVNPQQGVGMVPVVLFPWDDRIRRLGWEDQQQPPKEPSRSRDTVSFATTVLNERDVIMGSGRARLANILDELRHQPLGDMVLCSNTCVPVVAGEDVASLVESNRDDFPVPLLYLTTTPQSMQGIFRDVLVRRRREAEQEAPAPPPRAINVVGFPRDPALLELESLLNTLGIQLNVALLPALSPELIDRLPGAGLNVFHPNELWRGHYDQLMFDSSLEAISPPAPFGRQGTVRWLRAVADALHLDVDLDATLGPQLEQEQATWDELRREATNHRLAYIVRGSDARLLTDPANSWGIPLIEASREMGFTVEVLLQRSPGTAETPEEKDLRATWDGDRACQIWTFAERHELAQRLQQGSFSAVYSEHFFDRRVTESGCTPFSGQYFERGLAGAVRTLQRLLDVCRLPFYRRYGRYLGQQAAAGPLSDPWGRQHQSTKEHR